MSRTDPLQDVLSPDEAGDLSMALDEVILARLKTLARAGSLNADGLVPPIETADDRAQLERWQALAARVEQAVNA